MIYPSQTIELTENQPVQQLITTKKKDDPVAVTDAEIFPSRQQLPVLWRFLFRFDIFNFEPVPKSQEVSTERSQYGSIVFLAILLPYIIYTSFMFLNFSTPRVNQVDSPIDEEAEYEAPEFAFGFYIIDSSSSIINDSTIFTYQLEQYVQEESSNGQIYSSKLISLVPCIPRWAPIQMFFLCPSEKLVIQGQIGRSSVVKYPRVKLLLCVNNATPGVTCNQSQIGTIFAKGRFFIAIQKPGQINVVTGQKDADSGTLRYFFIAPNLYVRVESFIQRDVVTINPDYFFRFFTDEEVYNQVGHSKLSISKITAISSDQYNVLPNSGAGRIDDSGARLLATDIRRPVLSWSMLLNGDERDEEIEYDTLLDLISLWGGMWGIMVSLFMLYFLRHNKLTFYKTHKSWEKFENNKKIKRTTMLRRAQILPINESRDDSRDGINKPRDEEEEQNDKCNISKSESKERISLSISEFKEKISLSRLGSKERISISKSQSNERIILTGSNQKENIVLQRSQSKQRIQIPRFKLKPLNNNFISKTSDEINDQTVS